MSIPSFTLTFPHTPRRDRLPNASPRRAPTRASAASPSTSDLYFTVQEACSPHPLGTAVFLHDFMTDARQFSWLFQQPRLREYRLIALDMRGFGRSPDPTCAYSRVEDVLGVLQDPKQKVHMVGTGMGGVVALEFALAQAGRTESVSVLGTGLPGHAWPTEAYMDISEPRKSGITQQLLGEPNDAMELVRWKQMFIERNETWDVIRKGDAHVGKALVKMARSYRGFHFFQYDPLEPDPMEVPPLVDRLGLVNVPVLVMVGTCDTKEFRAIAQEVVNGIDNTKGVVAVHEAGHFLTLEQPQCVAEELISFWHSLSNS